MYILFRWNIIRDCEYEHGIEGEAKDRPRKHTPSRRSSHR